MGRTYQLRHVLVILALSVGCINMVDVQPEPPEEAETPGAFESDMILTPEQKTALENDIEGLQTRKAHADVTKRWPGAIVPYEISSTSQGDKDVILSAIQYWESVSCLRFPAYSASAGHTSRIRFVKKSGCWSYVGVSNPGGAQEISIGYRCEYRGTIAHEIGHAIGFWHEQSRSDRDDYVTIHSENIESGKENNFRKYTSATINSYGVAYDPGSIMHYGTHYFSKNGQPTISAKNPVDQAKIGQRNYLSAADIELANIIYNCPAGGNKIYGIGTDRKIYSRDDIQGTWSGPAPNSCCVIAMTVLRDGTIVGVGTSNRLWTKSSLDATWQGPVANSGSVLDITEMPDGTIVGIGMNNLLYTRPGVEGKWSGPVSNSGSVKSISVLPHGSILGVGMNGKLYKRPGIQGVWTNVDDNGIVSDISVNKDGAVIGIGTTCGLWERPSYTSYWQGEIASSRCVTSVSFVEKEEQVEKTEKVYGIGTDKKIYTRDGIEGKWTGPAPNSCCVIAMTVLQDGTIVGVGTYNRLWTKSSLDATWQGPVANSGSVLDITVMPDGTIVGIGMNNLLYTRPGVEGKWSGPVSNSGSVKSISVLPDGSILGVGMNGKLYKRPGIQGVWTNVDGNGIVSDISVNKDGAVIGIGTTCGLWERSSYTSYWQGEISNSRCVTSVSFGI